MPRIEPVPVSAIEPGGWTRLQEAFAQGKASETLFGQILAYHSRIFESHVDSVMNRQFSGLLGSRLLELIRLRSAQLGGCALCQAARYTGEVEESDVECLTIGSEGTLDQREQQAMEFVRLMHMDHHSIDDDTYRRLHEVFTTAEIVELGVTTAALLGIHRWLHTLDLAGTAPPAIAFDPADQYQHDAAH